MRACGEDSDLTAKGVQQARELRESFRAPKANEVAVHRPPAIKTVVSSSLRRCLKTAQIAFGELIESDGRMVVTDLWREYGGNMPSQYRAAKSELLASYSAAKRPFDEALTLQQIDFSAVSETDEMRWEEMEQRTPGRVETRAWAALLFVMDRPERARRGARARSSP